MRNTFTDNYMMLTVGLSSILEWDARLGPTDLAYIGSWARDGRGMIACDGQEIGIASIQGF